MGKEPLLCTAQMQLLIPPNSLRVLENHLLFPTDIWTLGLPSHAAQGPQPLPEGALICTLSRPIAGSAEPTGLNQRPREPRTCLEQEGKLFCCFRSKGEAWLTSSDPHQPCHCVRTEECQDTNETPSVRKCSLSQGRCG